MLRICRGAATTWRARRERVARSLADGPHWVGDPGGKVKRGIWHDRRQANAATPQTTRYVLRANPCALLQESGVVMMRFVTVLVLGCAMGISVGPWYTADAQSPASPLPNPQPIPERPPAAATPPPEEIQPRGDTLSDTLTRRDGVLPPPRVGQGMVVDPPEKGTMQVIPPPGTPGGNPRIEPR